MPERPEHESGLQFIAQASTTIDAFRQSIERLADWSCTFRFTSTPQEQGWPNDEPVIIAVFDSVALKAIPDLSKSAAMSVMCGWTNQEALLALNAGVSMFFYLADSTENQRAQLRKLYLQYCSIIEARRWRHAGIALAAQHQCTPSVLIKKLNSTYSKHSPPTQNIALRCGVDWQYIDWQTIRYVEAAGDYMCVHTVEETLIVRSTLTDLAERLPKQAFTRVNRSIIVNTHHVKGLVKLNPRVNYVELRDGSRVKISRRLLPFCSRQLSELPSLTL